MKPIYFPYTTISEPVLGALLACFKQVAVYQPSRSHVPESLRSWENGGRLRIHLLNNDENDPLPHLLKAYREWAALHEGERPDFEKFRPPLPPFTDASATSRIRSDTQKTAKGIETAPSREERERALLLRARLFLTIAQEHDQLRQTLREDLDRIGGMEKDLFRNLLSDRDEPFPAAPRNRPPLEIEPGSHMSGARMTAWARLHVHHRERAKRGAASMPGTTDLMITSDPSALDRLLEQADEADLICSVSGIPFGPAADLSGNVFFDGRRSEKLEKLTAGPGSSAGWNAVFPGAGPETGDTGRLTLYRIRGDAAARLVSGSDNAPEPSRTHKDASETRYTLAGSIVENAPC